MLKVMTEEKEKTRENKKPRVFLKKGFGWGGEREKKGAERFSNCRKPFFCRTDNNTPLKNPRIARKAALVVIISKQKTDTNTKRENQPKKINNTTTIKTATPEKPGDLKCKKLGFGKEMRWNWP